MRNSKLQPKKNGGDAPLYTSEQLSKRGNSRKEGYELNKQLIKESKRGAIQAKDQISRDRYTTNEARAKGAVSEYEKKYAPMAKMQLNKPGKISASANMPNEIIRTKINEAAKKGGLFKKKG
jgi:hypothetical protein